MGLFTIKSRSDSSHQPPFNGQNQKRQNKEEIQVLPDKGIATEVNISNTLKTKLRLSKLSRKKAETGFNLLEMAEEGIKNIKSAIETEKDFEKLREQIELICKNTTFQGKKILDRDGHQEFLKYFSTFEIKAPDECRFAPNLSPFCLKLNDGLALDFLKKHEDLFKEKKISIIEELNQNRPLGNFSEILEKAKIDISKNQEVGLKSQTDLFTQDLLKII